MSAASALVAVDRIAAALDERGFAIEPGLLGSGEVAALRARLMALDAEGALAPAGIGRGARRFERSDIRGDRIGWLGSVPLAPAELPLFALLESLRLSLNRALGLGLFEFEGHYAVYPPGVGYARHRDVFRDDAARIVSCVLYFNDVWRAGDAGELRLFLDDGTPLEVAPEGGTFVCFRSERFEHEVRPTARERLAVTGWFRRRGAVPA